MEETLAHEVLAFQIFFVVVVSMATIPTEFCRAFFHFLCHQILQKQLTTY